MKKLLGVLLSVILAISCVPFVPTNAKDGSGARSIDRSNWTGMACDGTSREENVPGGLYPNDGNVNCMFDDNTTTLFHTNYGDGDEATLPVYIFIDLGSKTTFGAFSWQNRSQNDAAKHYEFYVNETDNALIPDSVDEGYEGNTNGWSLVANSTESKYLQANVKNIVDLDKMVTTKEVMIKITSTHGTASGSNGHVTCKDFQLYSSYKNREEGTLNRIYWTGYAFDVNDREENNQNHPSDGPISYMLDGDENTLFHTNYAEGNSTTLPVYVFLDLGKTSVFSAFSWHNREQNAVTTYEMYINKTDTDLMEDFNSKTDGVEGLPEGWEKVNEGTLKASKRNIVNLENNVTTKQIAFKITGINTNHNTYVTCREFNLYENKVSENTGNTGNTFSRIDMEAIDATASVDCADGISVGTDGARDNASVVVDGKTDNFLSVASAGSAPIFVTIDMKGVYNIDKVDVDVYDGRIYNNVVIVTADTLEGFERLNEHYVIYNTDSSNISGYGQECDIQAGQPNLISATADECVTGRYVRVYMYGSTANNGNHIYEVFVYGDKNTDSVTVEEDGYLLEGIYENDTFSRLASDVSTGVKRYVTNKVLSVKAQARLEANGTYTIRFVSSVASLTPMKVGFDVQKNSGNVKTFESKKVYGKVLESVGGRSVMVEPRIIFDNNASDYFFTFKVTGVPSDIKDDQTITITPYWYVNSMEGAQKVTGTATTYKIVDIIATLK